MSRNNSFTWLAAKWHTKMDNDLHNLILTLVIAAVILLIGVSVVSSTVDTTVATGSESEAALLDGTEWTTLGDTIGANETVYDSRGYAVELTGANDSYIQSEQNVQLASDTNWTVSVWAARNASENMTAVSVQGRLLINYNASQDNWTAWYYKDDSRDSFDVSVNATAKQDELVNVMAIRNGSTLTLHAGNNSQNNSVTISGNNTVDAPVNNTNWDGELEELRLSDTPWNDTTRQNHVDNPIDPQPVNMTGRVMFDQPDKSTQLFFYADGGITTSNVTFVSGLPGSQLSSGGIFNSGDYDWRERGPEIRATSGGELDGAPVAYVDYDTKDRAGAFLDSFVAGIGLAGVLLILVPVGAIVTYLYAFQGGRR